MNILKQFTKSSIAATITHIVFFAITAFLDTIMNSEISNIIGLIVDKILDYTVQQYIFMKKITPDGKIITKFIVSEIFLLSINQILFTIYYRNYYKEGDNLTVARAVIGLVIYTLIVFPIRKFFIYK